MIIGKNMINNEEETNFYYLFDKIDNYNWMKFLGESLKEYNIIIKQILVKNISDVGDGPEEYSFNNIEEYLNAFNKTIFENSINWINLMCVHENLDFTISVDAHMNKMQVTLYGNENNISFDNVVSNAINRRM